MTDSLSEKNLAWRNTLKIEYKKIKENSKIL